MIKLPTTIIEGIKNFLLFSGFFSKLKFSKNKKSRRELEVIEEWDIKEFF